MFFFVSNNLCFKYVVCNNLFITRVDEAARKLEVVLEEGEGQEHLYIVGLPKQTLELIFFEHINIYLFEEPMKNLSIKQIL